MFKYKSLNALLASSKIISFILIFLISQFTVLAQISAQTSQQELEITVLDQVMGKGIAGIKISIKHEISGSEQTGISNEEGVFLANLVPYRTYTIQVEDSRYFKTAPANLTIKEADMFPKKVVCNLQEIVLGMAIRWEDIVFLPNSEQINTSSQVSVDSLVNLLTENRNVRFEISCHTDSRGNDDYNMKLSQKRAESLVDYLVSRGIENQVLTPKGYGESRLINHCRNKIRCSSSQHQENRRVELIILSLQ